MLEIVTLIIEGIKGNSPYLKHLCEENRMLCVQEHWLHGYEINTIQGILSGFDFNISCFDDEKLILNYKKEEEKGELSLSGHESSHIRLKNWKKMKDL